jgi:lipoprotein-anchoring transpeptidase ErfK/SrfK
VIGSSTLYSPSRRWVHTPEGYIYAPSLQPVKNLPNDPISDLPVYNGERGFWAEVTVPYISLELINVQPQAPWLVESPRDLWKLYYSQVVWVDEIRINSKGVVQYRVSELYASYGDVFWADAYAFRIITPEEIAPINPDATDKRIIVNVNQQNLSCYEGNNEVYFCQVSTGKKFDIYGNPVDDLKTPKGEHWIWRKSVSFHMSGGGTGAGWDTMGIGWTTLFVGTGVAIHSTFWHNDFGTPKSHGCVNVMPEDSKWIFRWTRPYVEYFPGDITDNSFASTKIEVIEPLY